MAALGWEGWYCIVIILVGVGFMARDIVGPDIAMMGMLIVMMLPGEQVVSIDKALAGFSNEGLITVGSASRRDFVPTSYCNDCSGTLQLFIMMLRAI